MANKIQQVAALKRSKHVPAEGSQLWMEGPPDTKDVQMLKNYISAMYMGLKDMQKHVDELDVFVSGGVGIPTEEFLRGELQAQKMRVDNLQKRLDDALSEVEDSSVKNSS